MIEGVLSLLLLVSAGPGGADAVAPGDPLYGLDRALEAAMMDGVLTEDEAIALQTQFADERIFEAELMAGRGDTAGVAAALNEYDVELVGLIDMTASYQGDNPDAVVQGLDVSLQSQDRRLAALEHNPNLQDDGDDGGEGDGDDQDADADDAEGDGSDNAVCSRTDHPVATRIAEEYGVTYEQVVAWFCAEGEARYGFGEISMVLRIAEESGHPVDEIVAMRESGMGWGLIKKELGIHGNANGNGNGRGNGNGHGNGNGNGNGGGNGNGNANGNGNPNGGGGDDDDDNVSPTAEPTNDNSGS